MKDEKLISEILDIVREIMTGEQYITFVHRIQLLRFEKSKKHLEAVEKLVDLIKENI